MRSERSFGAKRSVATMWAPVKATGDCLSSAGKFGEAGGWFERAVAAREQGDVHGRVDHESLAYSLRSTAACLRKLGLQHDALLFEEKLNQILV